MLLRKATEVFFQLIIVSGIATALAVASVFTFYRFVRRPSTVLMLFNTAATTALVLAGALFLEGRTLVAYLFFVAYMYAYTSLGRHVVRYDDTFRMLFLSMGYTRQEFFVNYLLARGKWKLVNNILTFSVIGTTIVIFCDELRRLYPDQGRPVVLTLILVSVLISISGWLSSDFVNTSSKEE